MVQAKAKKANPVVLEQDCSPVDKHIAHVGVHKGGHHEGSPHVDSEACGTRAHKDTSRKTREHINQNSLSGGWEKRQKNGKEGKSRTGRVSDGLHSGNISRKHVVGHQSVVHLKGSACHPEERKGRARTHIQTVIEAPHKNTCSTVSRRDKPRGTAPKQVQGRAPIGDALVQHDAGN